MPLKVKYVVRVERGVLNRAIYDMAVLFDPSSAAADGGLAGWNRKLLWSFGGGSGTPYKQFAPNSTWQVDYALARGYLVAVSAHTDQQLNSNSLGLLRANAECEIPLRVGFRMGGTIFGRWSTGRG